jgi:hypothetical protein
LNAWLKIAIVVMKWEGGGSLGHCYLMKRDVSDFSKDWNIECEKYDLSNTQKPRNLSRYCLKDIGEAMEKMQEYIDKDVFRFELE